MFSTALRRRFSSQAAFLFLEAQKLLDAPLKGLLASPAGAAAAEAVFSLDGKSKTTRRVRLATSAAAALSRALPPLLVKHLVLLQQKRQLRALEEETGLHGHCRRDAAELEALDGLGAELLSAPEQLELVARACETCFSIAPARRAPYRQQLECLYAFVRWLQIEFSPVSPLACEGRFWGTVEMQSLQKELEKQVQTAQGSALRFSEHWATLLSAVKERREETAAFASVAAS